MQVRVSKSADYRYIPRQGFIIITDVDVDVDLDPDPDLNSGVSTVDAVIACVVFDRPIMPNTT